MSPPPSTPSDDGGDHMKDAGPGLPPGASLATFPALRLDSGAVLRDVRCAYSTYGELNAAGDNVVVVGHSLTSNSCVHEWWGEMLGAGPAFALDTDRDFIVCANYLGSPYGTSSPCTPDPAKRGRDDDHHDDHHASSSSPSSSSSSFSAWYGADFPTPCTIRDNVRLQKMLLDHLGAKKIRCAIGGSMGAMLALEWGATHPDLVESLVLIAGCGKHTDWAIGIGEAERFAIAADAKFLGGAYDPRDPPLGGLAAARMTAMLTYRAPRSVDDRHRRAREASPPPDAHADAELKVVRRATPGAAGALPHFEVESYLRYQGRKFTKRFDANCYAQLTHTLDSHDVAEDKGGDYEATMRAIAQPTMVVGITSDLLYPIHLQEEMARLMPRAEMRAIDSVHGHDAFLIEIRALNRDVAAFRAKVRTDEENSNDASSASLDSRLDWFEDDPAVPPAPSYGVADAPFRASVLAALAGDRSRCLSPAFGDDVSAYQRDMGHHAPSSPPDVVALPVSTAETARVVRLCWSRRVPLTTRGAGTGLEGGCVPYSGGVVLDTSRLKHLAWDDGEQVATCGAGVLKNELNAFLKPKNRVFGPDPSSNPSVGGMASTGGSGMSTLRYGTSKENVRAMTVVTPSGRVIRTRRAVRKSSTGYELNALYLGAEGTLGVITEVTVRTFPIPKVRCGAVVSFETVADAARTVVRATEANLETMLRCELMNDEGIRCTNAVFGTRLAERPTLFLEFSSDDRRRCVREWREVRAMAIARGADRRSIRFAASGETLDALWDARRGCYLGAMKYCGIVDGTGRKQKVYVGDVCVPRGKLAECAAKTEEDFKRAGFPCVMCAHISDGNFHCLIPYDREDEERLEKLNDSVIRRAIAMGGAASGEHGVGVGKMRHVQWEHGPFHVDAQRRVKRALDPRMIMNPGKVISIEPTEEERSARHRSMGGASASKL